MPKQTRVVAFIDVIGWSNAFDDPRLGHDKLVEVARSIAEYRKMFSPEQKARILEFAEKLEHDTGRAQDPNSAYHDIAFSFVSDCFVVSSSPEQVGNLMNVSRWACMTLLGNHGFLTRGGVCMGVTTHDEAQDIVVGKPLSDAVALEKSTAMPRIELSNVVVDCLRDYEGADADRFVFFDGEKQILNIAGVGADWLNVAKEEVVQGLKLAPCEKARAKWLYMQQQLPRMSAVTDKFPSLWMPKPRGQTTSDDRTPGR
jgi:hypothetical protein